MKKVIAILLILALMYAEYRYIMCNLRLYYADNGFICIEIFGQMDSYYAEPIFVTE